MHARFAAEPLCRAEQDVEILLLSHVPRMQDRESTRRYEASAELVFWFWYGRELIDVDRDRDDSDASLRTCLTRDPSLHSLAKGVHFFGQRVCAACHPTRDGDDSSAPKHTQFDRDVRHHVVYGQIAWHAQDSGNHRRCESIAQGRARDVRSVSPAKGANHVRHGEKGKRDLVQEASDR